MKIQYLGTGASEGFPGLFCECEVCKRAMSAGGRNLKMRSCSIINNRVLIDISPDIYAQKLRFNLNLAKVESLIVTHSHEDHFDLFSACLRGKESCSKIVTQYGERNCLNIYGNKEVQRVLEQGFERQPNMKRERYEFHIVTPFRAFSVSGLNFIPFIANHKKDEECLIYSIDDGKSRLLYANDTDIIADINYEKMHGMYFDVVSMDCARGQYYGDGHMGIHENIKMVKHLKEVGCIDEKTRFILNHISHMCDMTHDELQEVVSPFGFMVSYDGLVIEL